MTIECSKCNEFVATTATVIRMPFVCHDCACYADQEYLPAQPTIKTIPAPSGGTISFPVPDCATSTVENTTLLIADLEQQVSSERSLVIALRENMGAQLKTIDFLTAREVALNAQVEFINSEMNIARENYLGAERQILNQAETIRRQEEEIDQDLNAINRLLKEKATLAQENVELYHSAANQEDVNGRLQQSVLDIHTEYSRTRGELTRALDANIDILAENKELRELREELYQSVDAQDDVNGHLCERLDRLKDRGFWERVFRVGE
jgi:hypothetical protein